MPQADNRIAVRSRVVVHALTLRVVRGPRQLSRAVRKVLIAHHLLAGDTFMLTALLAKTRARY